jgi:hypothetical protein
MHETYVLWMNQSDMIFTSKSWDDKFMMLSSLNNDFLNCAICIEF